MLHRWHLGFHGAAEDAQPTTCAGMMHITLQVDRLHTYLHHPATGQRTHYTHYSSALPLQLLHLLSDFGLVLVLVDSLFAGFSRQ